MKKELKQRSRNLRKNQTDAEKLLWYHLRSRQMENTKFRRQHPVGGYIVDFICLEKRLIIEIDGGQHNEQVEYDAKRTRYLESLGYNVIRFWNHDVLQKKNVVLEYIFNILAAPSPLPSPSREREKKTDLTNPKKESKKALHITPSSLRDGEKKLTSSSLENGPNEIPHTIPSPLWGEG